jgi:hypothetical protein
MKKTEIYIRDNLIYEDNIKECLGQILEGTP